MKKIKWTIMTLVVSLSVGAAFATAPHFDCRTVQQYYATGGSYMPTGTYGVNYFCNSGTDVCTYTTDGIGDYYPCRAGIYAPVGGGVSDNAVNHKTGKK
jgi:hypothetical protein